MVKTTFLELFIINRVILLRLIMGLSKRQLSLNLKHNESYVAKIESEVEENSYPPHEWPKLAMEFNCTIQDLLPPDNIEQNSTGKLIEKKVLNLNLQGDLKRVIDGLLAYGYFDRPKTADEITKHLFIEKEEQVGLLKSVMEGIVKDGRLKLRAIEYYRDIV